MLFRNLYRNCKSKCSTRRQKNLNSALDKIESSPFVVQCHPHTLRVNLQKLVLNTLNFVYMNVINGTPDY